MQIHWILQCINWKIFHFFLNFQVFPKQIARGQSRLCMCGCGCLCVFWTWQLQIEIFHYGHYVFFVKNKFWKLFSRFFLFFYVRLNFDNNQHFNELPTNQPTNERTNEKKLKMKMKPSTASKLYFAVDFFFFLVSSPLFYSTVWHISFHFFSYFTVGFFSIYGGHIYIIHNNELWNNEKKWAE